MNFADAEALETFFRSIKKENPDALVITGDISESQYLNGHLDLFETVFKDIPTYFVLGNHDYYNSSIENVRVNMRQNYNVADNGKAFWLPNKPFVKLTSNTALIGHDGWYDGQYANWFKSRLVMEDYTVIQELSAKSCPLSQLRYDKLQELAIEASNHVEYGMRAAISAGFKSLYVATHVPPFKENSTYAGRMSNDTWMPHFSSGHMGDAILQVAAEFPDVSIVTMCGHSHGKVSHRAMHNLICHTGGARYRAPSIAGIFEVP